MKEPPNRTTMTSAERKLRKSAAALKSIISKYGDLPLDARKQVIQGVAKDVLNKAMQQLIQEENILEKDHEHELRKMLESMIDRIFIEELGIDYKRLGSY